MSSLFEVSNEWGVDFWSDIFILLEVVRHYGITLPMTSRTSFWCTVMKVWKIFTHFCSGFRVNLFMFEIISQPVYTSSKSTLGTADQRAKPI